MKSKITKFIAGIMVLTMVWGMSVFAAPKTMADGGVFDPEYYAQQNPDVVAALGTDENILYQHYLTNGKNEGRLPYESNVSAATVKRTRKYIFSSASTRNNLIEKLLNYQNKNNTVILQEMSDGTINITQTVAGKNAFVFVNTGKPTGLSSGGYTYINTASTNGKVGNVQLLYADGVIGLEYLDDDGYFMWGEAYYEPVGY